ncbi:thioredoxin family protein [Sphingomonas sp.]|uniref:thioredoxin family protein n=1 Tax=Sphingomonas sp. TaxID=28214 RepID=UPI003B3BE94B
MILGGLLVVIGCRPRSVEQAGPQVTATPESIAWREGDVNAAFRDARQTGKPILLYWGAKWCPPCRALEATHFRNASVVAEMRHFLPVHLDGDAKGAQRWGDRFHIGGYPTIIVLRSDGSEVMRLSRVAAPAQFAAALRAMAAQAAPISALLGQALADPGKLTHDQWEAIAAYDWLDTSGRFADRAANAHMLERLAVVAPDPKLARRFAIYALTPRTIAASTTLSASEQSEVWQILPELIGSEQEVSSNLPYLGYVAPRLIAALPPSPARTALGNHLLRVLDKAAEDEQLGLADRVRTLDAEIVLAKADNGGRIPAAVVARIYRRIGQAERAAHTPALRQSVLEAISDILVEAGDAREAARILGNDLSHAAVPAYYMRALGQIEAQRGDTFLAVRWARRAAEAAVGEDSRLRWAIDYSMTAIRMTPTDGPGVNASARTVLAAAAQGRGNYSTTTRDRVDAWRKAYARWCRSYSATCSS